jgi:hypothetical protein
MPPSVSSFTSPWVGWVTSGLTVVMSPGLLVSGRRFSPLPWALRSHWLWRNRQRFEDTEGRRFVTSVIVPASPKPSCCHCCGVYTRVLLKELLILVTQQSVAENLVQVQV